MRKHLELFMSELLLQGSDNEFCLGRFCLQCPASYPDTYIKEFNFIPNPLKMPQNQEKSALFQVVFSGKEIVQKLATKEVILHADIYEIYAGDKPPENAIIRNQVLYKFHLQVNQKSYCPLDILLTGPGIILPPNINHIPCLDLRKDAKTPYTIRFFNFDYFEQVAFQTGKLVESNEIGSSIYFTPDIEICLQNKPLKIDNLSTYLTDDYHLSDTLKIHLYTHQPQQTLNPPPFIFDRFFLHGHNVKINKWQLQGTRIETVLFSSSIAFLTQNKNDPDIQEILSSIKLNFDEQKLEDLLDKDIEERLTHLRLKENENSDPNPKQLNPKIIQEHINVYEYLLNDPHQAHQRDEIHRYIAYFRSRLSWRKRAIFSLTGDYFKIGTPFLWAIGLYAFRTGLLSIEYFKNTIPFYEIFNFKPETTHFWETVLITLCKSMPNIIRWAIEGGITYCLFAAGAAIKKQFGMGNSKDFFSSHSA